MTPRLDDKVEQLNNKAKLLKDKANNFKLNPPRSEQKALMEAIESISKLDWSSANTNWSANVVIVQKMTDKIEKLLGEMPAVSPTERGDLLKLLTEIKECANQLSKPSDDEGNPIQD